MESLVSGHPPDAKKVYVTGAWAPFLDMPGNFSGPESWFMFAMFAFKLQQFAKDTMKLSFNQAKLTGL